MSQKRILTALFLIALLASTARDAAAGAKCGGRFFNPVSDVDWRAMFPIKIGGVSVTPGRGNRHRKPFPYLFLRVAGPKGRHKGFLLGAGETDRGRKAPRMLPVARGQKASPSLFRHGWGIRGGAGGQRGDRTSFLHVHHFIYPVFSVLSLFSSFGCMTQGGFDLAYMTAFDPLWSNDELSFLLHPEIALVANPVAQASCAADRRGHSRGLCAKRAFLVRRVVGEHPIRTRETTGRRGTSRPSTLSLQ